MTARGVQAPEGSQAIWVPSPPKAEGRRLAYPALQT